MRKNQILMKQKKQWVHSSRLLLNVTLNEGTDAEGWYLVPVEFAREVFRIAWDAGIVRRYARIIPMWTDTKDISAITEGITVYWTAEGNAYTGSKPTVWQIQLVAKKATALVSATNELIDDNMTDQEVWSLVSELIAEAMAEFEDTNVLASSTQFTPLISDTNVNAVSLGTGKTSFANITYDALIDAIRAVPMKYKKGQPRWFMSQDAVAHIEKLKDDNKQPIFFSTREHKRRTNRKQIALIPCWNHWRSSLWCWWWSFKRIHPIWRS